MSAVRAAIDPFAGEALPLAPEAWAEAARILGVSIAKVRAVSEVESHGRAFHPDTGRPVILFEPHVFSRLTAHRFDASHPELSYPTWGERDYPVSQVIRYEQLRAAMELDRAAALQACSWGRFQIMGFNCKPAGFANVTAFWSAMKRSEGEQLRAFARFVGCSPPMKAALQAGDWAGFARRYNGKGYAQHGYDQKLKVAFARWRAADAAAQA
jgi:hypothetical protein